MLDTECVGRIFITLLEVNVMTLRSETLLVKLNSTEADAVRHALAADQRVKLLEMLAKKTMNVNEIAAALGVSHPTASMHIRALQDAGLLESAYSTTDKGAEKRCWTTCSRIIFEIETHPDETAGKVEEVTIPVGLYNVVNVVPPCGLTGRRASIASSSHPLMTPDRELGQNLWFTGGWVEYSFPFHLPANAVLTAIEFEAEICSEAPGYDNDYPSDITVWMNGAEVGTWTSPGDFGGRRGRLNPSWWPDSFTQYGILKNWKIDDNGSYIDGEKAGDLTLADLHLAPGAPLAVRIGIKEDAKYQGGVNLFGKRLGDHPQDLTLRYRYTLSE